MNLVSKEMVVAAGLLAMPVVAANAHLPNPPEQPSKDYRLQRLKVFFSKLECPIAKFASDFLTAADRNALDWRLLPSISVIESGGGKNYRNNNIFGWDSCREFFPSVRAGIHQVAERLSHSPLYRHKDVDHILATYNPEPEYAARVKALMRELSAPEHTTACLQ